jgi:hypothetical protein
MIFENTFADRVAFLVIGMFIGFILGRITARYGYIIERPETVDNEGMNERTERLGKTAIGGTALFAVVLLTALSAIFSGFVNARLQSTNETLKDVNRCTEKVLGTVIVALNQRTQYNSDIARADRAQNEAFSKIVTISLKKPPVDKEKARKIVSDYGEKLNTYIGLVNKQSKIQDNNPYPDIQDYQHCIREAKGEKAEDK